MQKEKQKKQPSGCTKALRLLGVIVIGIILTFAGLAWLGSSGLLDTPTPQSNPNQQEQSMTYQQQIEQALNDIPLVTITSVGVFDSSGRILVTFQMVNNNVDIAEDHMKKIACAIKEVGTNGYGLRLAGDQPGGITVITATISEEAVNDLDCGVMSVPDWSVIADEYSVASGLR